ncbi:bifunctional phosphopantothenoylcysteine decarboxylase/phosphopantothenate--cysteine ligase CoaBC [Alicyclobacillus ferrooxydans]|uniref:Coenzyme A biosynthesis bifunctional protein CoaBC n=1 Tax=Alicyclobacillus ferrooxydans TaxID=471514 RepID=A0A0P9GVP1_9BACL|nr:bifunctional phosphopantothenoylcysteine decarboxylase/phosphopantothenate--cysteine ligase CoaBC [Alicyclobacillus ferrooxydans]KPV45343.1 phosphopantothenoylcysteine decarboxylase [Alicyclobacillus ferrooxydans]
MNQRILLAVGGGIAAYKAASLCSLLVKHGYDVQVLMTRNATEFIKPLTFQSLSRNPVVVSTFEEPNPAEIAHVAMADRADLFVVAPATANLIGKLAHGIADDMVTTTALVCQAPLLIAPAMNVHMYDHPAVQENLRILRQRGAIVVDPGSGPLACGYTGKGRLAEPEEIKDVVDAVLTRQSDLSDLRVLVTAGPTVEDIDPVRFVSNGSSGKMGYAIAEAAVSRGAKVTLVTGPSHLEPVAGAEMVRVRSTEQMKDAVLKRLSTVDAVIGAAAPVDFRPAERFDQKWKKSDGLPQIDWVQTPDILASVAKAKEARHVVVGFAAETRDVVLNAEKKLVSKDLDFVVGNQIGEEGVGFGTDTNRVIIVSKNGPDPLPLMSKLDVANEILSRVRIVFDGRLGTRARRETDQL